MDIEKSMTVAAPSDRVWQMLLDPQVMAGCVPGMQSIEVISPTEYKALMQVKISFISAKFKLKTRIVEQRAPHYLRCEGTGEDASVASSMKQHSELFLAELPGGSTELRMKVKVDVLGRLGSFGLGVMKTKADRLWDEFGQNLVRRLESGATPASESIANNSDLQRPESLLITSTEAAPTANVPAAPGTAATAAAPPAPPAPAARPAPATVAAGADRAAAPQGWWQRLFGAAPVAAAQVPDDRIRIEIRRAHETVSIDWPLQGSAECSRWLQDYLKPA